MSETVKRFKFSFIRKSEISQVIAYPPQEIIEPGGLFKNATKIPKQGEIFIFTNTKLDRPYRFAYSDDSKFEESLKNIIDELENKDKEFIKISTYDL